MDELKLSFLCEKKEDWRVEKSASKSRADEVAKPANLKENEEQILIEKTEILVDLLESQRSANYEKDTEDIMDGEILRKKEETPKIALKFIDRTSSIYR